MSGTMLASGLAAVALMLSLLSGAVCAEQAGLPGAAAHAAAEGQPETAAEHEHIGAAGVSEEVAEIKTDLAIYTFIVFLVLMAILWRFAWRPICEALERREQSIAAEIEEAKRSNEQARQLLADYERKLSEAQLEVQAIMAEARRDAQVVKDQIVQQAQQEAEQARQAAQRDIERARDQALQELFDQAAGLATQIAARLLNRSLNPEDHRDLVQQALEQLPSKN